MKALSTMVSAAFALASYAVVAAAQAPDAGRPFGAGNDRAPLIEIRFDAPRPFLVIAEAHGDRRRLYGVGDAIPTPSVSGPLQLAAIHGRHVEFVHGTNRKPVRAAVGQPVPLLSGWQLSKVVFVQTLHRRYVATAAALDPEPRLAGIAHGTAFLEIDVPPLAARTRPRGPAVDPASREEVRNPAPLLERVSVRQTAPDQYDVSARDLQRALNEGGRLLAESWPTVWPIVSSGGVDLHVRSLVADGVMGGGGFRVTDPRLAARAGIEAGDVILAIDGESIGSFGDLYRLYLRATREPLRRELSVSLRRRGELVTKLYRMR